MRHEAEPEDLGVVLLTETGGNQRKVAATAICNESCEICDEKSGRRIELREEDVEGLGWWWW